MLITLPFFLRDITCLTRIQVILKPLSFELKDKLFKKPNPIGWVTWKRIDKTGQMVWSQFSIMILGVYFDNSVLDNSNWDKISNSLTKKKINILKRVRLSLGWKKKSSYPKFGI